MSVLAARVVEFDPLKDKSYRQTRLGRSVADFLAWKDLGGAADRTLEQYERDLARACLMFPEKGLREFSDDDMLQVARTFKPRERRTRVAAYRSFFKWALRARKIKLNPCDALPQIKPPPKKVYDVFSDAEITSLCALPIRDGALMTLMFETGARNADCCGARLRDWKRDATPEYPYGLIVFWEGKGGKDRQVPVTLPLAQKLVELETLEGLSPGDYLWYRRPGGRTVITRDGRIHGGTLWDWWGKCLEAADVRYRHPHMSRHTFATRFLRNRGRLQTLQLILGHESIETTANEYGHLDMRDVAIDLGIVHDLNLRES